MSDVFDDLDELRLDRSTSVGIPQTVVTSGCGRPPRHKPGERFLKGPVPWMWLTRASGLKGKALHVGVGIWQRAGREKAKTMKLSIPRLAREMGLSKDAARRGLEQLEGIGLVRVKRGPGRSPVITLLNPPAKEAV